MHVRRATVADADASAAVLNAVIAEGGRTAFDTAMSGPTFADVFITGPHCISCVVAIADDGRVLGFQALERFHDDLPPGVADIGTFVTATSRGSGVGRHLSNATLAAAERAGLRAVRAVIRRTNHDAQRFYRSIGFDADGTPTTTDSPVVLVRRLEPLTNSNA